MQMLSNPIMVIISIHSLQSTESLATGPQLCQVLSVLALLGSVCMSQKKKGHDILCTSSTRPSPCIERRDLVDLLFSEICEELDPFCWRHWFFGINSIFFNSGLLRLCHDSTCLAHNNPSSP